MNWLCTGRFLGRGKLHKLLYVGLGLSAVGFISKYRRRPIRTNEVSCSALDLHVGHTMGAEVKMWTESDILNRFLEDIYREECQFKLPAEAVSDLQAAVEELVRSMVLKVTHSVNCPMFRGSEIISRGSFYEGTKIGAPDEFDFLVELDLLSRPGAVEFLSECPQCPGCVHVRLVDPGLKKIGAEIQDSPVGDFLYPLSVSFKYQECLRQAYKKLFPESWRMVDKVRVEKGCGFLTQVEHITSSWGPNTLLTLTWTTTTFPEEHLLRVILLTVDVSPTFVYRPPNGNDSNMRPDRKCHVIPAADYRCQHGTGIRSCCWRIAHSSEETEKMKNMSETHKKVYKILKCVCKGHNKHLRSLTSYMLKTALLHHTDSCDDTGSVGACTVRILEDASQFSDRGHLPGYFIPEKNVWPRNDDNKVVTPKSIVEKLLQQLKHVAGLSADEYDYNRCFSHFQYMQEEFSRTEARLFAVHVYPYLE